MYTCRASSPHWCALRASVRPPLRHLPLPRAFSFCGLSFGRAVSVAKAVTRGARRRPQVDLINSDYGDLVHLSTTLVGIDDQIDAFARPMQALRKQIVAARDHTVAELEDTRRMFEEKQQVSANRATLELFVKVANSNTHLAALWRYEGEAGSDGAKGTTAHGGGGAGGDGRAAAEDDDDEDDFLPEDEDMVVERSPLHFLERVADELNTTNLMLARVPSELPFIVACKRELDAHSAKLLARLDVALRAALNAVDEAAVVATLRVYRSVSQQAHAEAMFRAEYVRPQCEAPQGEGDKWSLDVFYDAVRGFLRQDRTCCLLRAAAAATAAATGLASTAGASGEPFRFVQNSVWAEVVHVLLGKRVAVFRPANSAFQGNFKCSMLFVTDVEVGLQHVDAVLRFREHAATQEFFSKWQLQLKARPRLVLCSA